VSNHTAGYGEAKQRIRELESQLAALRGADELFRQSVRTLCDLWDSGFVLTDSEMLVKLMRNVRKAQAALDAAKEGK
jgi:predicted metal-dependent hydrolase